MNARKVLEMGGGTLLVSLPKAWARRNGVEKGDTLAVEELSANKLVVRPIDSEGEKQAEFSVGFSPGDMRQVVNDVTGAYLLGYDQIRIGGTRTIGREERSVLMEAIGRLVGLEIMEEDSKHVTVQFLLESSSVGPERLVRRMSGILEGMMRDTAEGLREKDGKLLSVVAERDDEVDRLYFLLVRTLRTATMHPEIAEKYGLAPVDTLDYRVLASFLESAGDALAELSVKIREVRTTDQMASDLSDCVLMLREMEELATGSFLIRRTSKSAEAYSRIRDLSARISDRVGGVVRRSGAESHLLVESLGALERTGRLLIDVSDLAMAAQVAG